MKDNKKMKKSFFTCRFFLFIFMIFSSQSFVFSQVTQVYKEKAVASFYAEDFHGKKTSSGELFDMNDLTCANKFLPFNTLIKVTNLANNLNVVVRVNDRGPFVENREIDLSKAAAHKLNMIKTGTTTVRIEIVKLGEDTKLSRQTAEKACQIMQQKTGKQYYVPDFSKYTAQSNKKETKVQYEAGTFWDIRIASFSNKDNAKRAAQKLYDEGFENIVYQTKDNITRVVLKAVPAQEMSKIEKKLKEKGYTDYIVVKRKT